MKHNYHECLDPKRLSAIMLKTLLAVLLMCNFSEIGGKPVSEDNILRDIISLLKEIYDEDVSRKHTLRQSGDVSCDIFHNAFIYTVDKETLWHLEPAENMFVEDGIILFVGKCSDESCTHEIDTYCSQTAKFIDLKENCKCKQVGINWLLGHGHSIYDLIDHIEQGGRPPVEILSEAVNDKPVVILEETSHSVWVNNIALQKYKEKVGDNTVVGGLILDGKYEGIILENAAMEIMEMALSPDSLSSDTDRKTLSDLNYKGLLYALDTLKMNGITSICDARSFWQIDNPKTWEKAKNDGVLTVRAILDLWAYPNLEDTYQIQTLKSLYSNDPNSLLRMSQIKVYSDGIVPSTTAAVFDKYKHPLPVANLGDRGLNYFNEERLAKYIKELQFFDGDKGFDFHIHAIGDRGISESLSAIKQNPDKHSRHRLTHLEIIHPHNITLFQKLGVTADFQVAGNFTLPDHKKEIAYQVGETKADFSFPVRSVLETGAVVTLSSDWDVSPVNPFIGLLHAIDRGDQSVTIKDAIEMYTVNAAYVMRQENKVGTLKENYEADFIVIDRDVVKLGMSDTKYKELKDTKVLMTFLKAKFIDLKGKVVLPGFHDVHTHPLEAKSPLGGTCKFSSGMNPEDAKLILENCKDKQVEQGGRPPVEILSEAVYDKPVVILEETSHSVWKYKEKVGDNTVVGGLILDGKYEGIILENAAMEIMEMPCRPTVCRATQIVKH
ncbi:hypothetical protein KUTeg_012896 [Tegillarca granosa]|uniref:Amidohydrolase 3 domain-containing protein n=1 Tax=Tegillarca granosa TaxID=220873 RepID=A0ABQ9EWP4_TEGGR|nr:hypothetical protein KUTeg_012896 [Tegillarca granosa]